MEEEYRVLFKKGKMSRYSLSKRYRPHIQRKFLHEPYHKPRTSSEHQMQMTATVLRSSFDRTEGESTRPMRWRSHVVGMSQSGPPASRRLKVMMIGLDTTGKRTCLCKLISYPAVKFCCRHEVEAARSDCSSGSDSCWELPIAMGPCIATAGLCPRLEPAIVRGALHCMPCKCRAALAVWAGHHTHSAWWRQFSWLGAVRESRWQPSEIFPSIDFCHEK